MNEAWKYEGEPPTLMDCHKYYNQQTPLLAAHDDWQSLTEVYITRVTPKGMICVSISRNPLFGGFWMHFEELKIVEVLCEEPEVSD